MRRVLCSFLLFAGIVSIARADYVLIRVAVAPGEELKKDENNPVPMDMAKPQNPDLKPGEYLLAVIDAKRESLEFKEFGKQKIPFLTHRLGRTASYFDAQEISFQFINPKQLRAPLAEYAVKRAALQNEKDRGPEKYLELAQWSAEMGLLDKTHELLGEIEKLLAMKGAPMPADAVAKAMTAYEQIKPILNGEFANRAQADRWKQRLNYSSVATNRHFALVHNSDDPKRDAVADKLKALEQNFQAFYTLFALKGRALPAPREKLVAILSSDTDLYRKAAQVFAIPERTNDGFHGPRENVVVFSHVRLDKPSQRFAAETRRISETYSVDLLKGQFRPFAKKIATQEELDANNKQFMADARAQVLALVDALLKEEADAATATHEGTRQLLTETGLLPADVELPEWLRFGVASLFDFPKGPFPFKAKDSIRLAFYTAPAGPHWEWRRMLDEMAKDNLVTDNSTEAILDTLLDAWKDRAAATLAQPREEGDMSDPAAEAELEIARGRAMAWGLAFYLFQSRFDDLQRFFAEVDKLPRDIEIDRYTFLKLFCQSFGIATEGLTPTNLRGNAASYEAFAKDWVKAIRAVSVPAVPLKWEIVPEPKKADPNNPNPLVPKGG
jgi:hypothetical protein